MTVVAEPSRGRSIAIVAFAALAGLVGCAEATAPAALPAQSAAQTSDAPATPLEPAESSAPTAADTAASVQATAVSQAAAGRAQASAAAVLAYRPKVAIRLQSYANALGVLREADRRAGQQATLIADAEWLSRTRTALRLMESAADQMTAVTSVPPEMTVTDGLIQQIDDETRLLNRDYALGIDIASPSAIAAASQRTTPILALLARANLELRRGAA